MANSIGVVMSIGQISFEFNTLTTWGMVPLIRAFVILFVDGDAQLVGFSVGAAGITSERLRRGRRREHS